MNQGESYSDVVNYGWLDPAKIIAMRILAPTLRHPERLGIYYVPESAGETAAVFDFRAYDFMLALNVEGLGTKIKISDRMKELAEKRQIAQSVGGKYHRKIMQDNAAMSINDAAAVGSDPFAYEDIVAAGDAAWFKEEAKVEDLFDGLKDAADEGLFAVPAGETPALPDIVYPDTLDLAGASMGLIRPKDRLTIGQHLREGDLIFGVSSPGPDANGISKIRRIADKLPYGYSTKLDDRTLGEAVLVPTPIRSRLINSILGAAELHRIVPITGHGWKKIMRDRKPFVYDIEYVPEPSGLFNFLIEAGRQYGFDVSNRENYQVWNMGVDLVFMAPVDSETAIRSNVEGNGDKLYVLGTVRKAEDGIKKVVLKPLDVTYIPD